MRTRPGAPERCERDLHERRIVSNEIGVVDPQLGERAWRLRLDDEVSVGCEPAVFGSSVFGLQIEGFDNFERVVPDVE